MTERNRGPLTDLPLRPSGPSRESPPLSRPPTPARTPRGPRGPTPGRRRSRAWLWLLLLALGIAGGGGGYLWLRPRPATPLFAPDEVDFGQLRLGEEGEPAAVSVTNDGETTMRIERLRLEGPQQADFQIVTDTCSGASRSPGESCEIAARFVPQGLGLRRAILHPQGNLAWRPHGVELTGVGVAPRVGLDPSAVDFAEQAVDQESDSQLVRISNDGTAPMVIESIELAGSHPNDFALEQRCAGRTFGPEERCAFRVAFRPRAAGPRHASVRIASDAPGEPATVDLAGIGLWSGPPFTAEPGELDFSSQRVGRPSQPRELRFVNRTAASRSVPELVPPRPESGFSIADDGCSDVVVDPGESCTLSVQFAPPAEGSLEAALTLREADSAAVNVTLAGTGVAPRLAVDRRSVDFGDLRIGFRSAARAVTVRNSGSDSFTVRSFAVGGGDAAAYTLRDDRCSDTRLGPGRQCTIGVVFSPRREGDHTARLEIRSDAAGEPESVTLAGRGTVSAFAVRPGRLEFEAVNRGERRRQRLEIINDGTARLEVRAVRTAGDAGGDYRLAEIGCRLDQGLAPGQTCALTVEFEPTADGPRDGLLVLEHDGPQSPREVGLTGFGVPPQPGFRTSPQTLDFGSWPVGDRAAIQTLTVRNTGRGDLVIRDVTLEGAQAGDFRIVPGTCQGAPRIIAGSECTIGVGFRAEAAGSRAAELVIRHNAGSGRDRVRLRGEGIR